MDQKRATIQGLIIAAVLAATGCSVAVLIGSGSVVLESSRGGIQTDTDVEIDDDDLAGNDKR